MAGSASNWFRPTAGPLAGQAVYISKAQRAGLRSGSILAGLNNGMPFTLGLANAQRPAASMQPGGQPTQAAVQKAGSAVVQFGKHKGRQVQNLPAGYQNWMLQQTSTHPPFQQVQAQIRTYQRAQQAAGQPAAPAQAAGPTPAGTPAGRQMARMPGGSIYHSGGMYNLYNAQGGLVKAYKTYNGARTALGKLPPPPKHAPASAHTPTPGNTPALPHGSAKAGDPATVPMHGPTSGNHKVIVGNTSYDVLDGQGSLVIVRDFSYGHMVVNAHTGDRLTQHATLQDAQKSMQSLAPQQISHAAKNLDATGRAIKTVIAETLPHPGSDRNTADDILNLSKNVQENSHYGRDPYIGTPKGGDRGDIFFASLQQAHGFDVLPQKVSKQGLDQMYASGEISQVMYRGAGGFERQTMDSALFGAGTNGRLHGAGMYTASAGANQKDKSSAENYARGYGDRSKVFHQREVLRMGLRKGAKTIDTVKLHRMRDRWVIRERANLKQSDPRYQQKKNLIDTFVSDQGQFALAMGYDAVTAHYPYDNFDGIIVLNRSAVVFQDTLE
jgi:hypothetical protein